MKKYFLPFGSFFFVLFWATEAYAQEESHGQWSFAAYSGLNYALSASMHGEIADYSDAVQNDRTSLEYPLAGASSLGIGFGAQFSYRYTKSSYGLYFGSYGLSYNAGRGGRFSETGRFSMALFSAMAGIEYVSGQSYQHWNFVGRIAAGPTVIATSYRSAGSGFTRFSDNSSALRLGIEIGIGERYHFSRSPIGIEASITYTNANLIGKSYVAPNAVGALFAQNTTINDGKNPDDANDSARTIDFLTLRIGGRIYF